MTEKLSKRDKFLQDVEFLEKAVAIIKKRAQFGTTVDMYVALSVLRSKANRMLEEDF